MYKERNKKDNHRPFLLFHCWNLLKNHEKWKTRNNELSFMKSRSSISSNADDDLEGEEEEEKEGDVGEEERGRSPTPSSAPPNSKRPLGRNHTKAKLKMPMGGAYKDLLQEMMCTKKEEKQFKVDKWAELKALEKENVDIEKERLQILAEESFTK